MTVIGLFGIQLSQDVTEPIPVETDTTYYGANLDALYDMLSTYPETVRIPPLNKGKLSYYGEVFRRVLTDAAAENSNVIIE